MSIITISRGTKSGGLELANRLAQRLNYKMIGREEVIADCSKKFNIMREELEAKLDKSPSIWQKFSNEYQSYITFVQCALMDAVKSDNIIYHGHSGQFLLKDLSNVLKVRIDAPMEYRIKSIIDQFDREKNAIDYIKGIDEKRKRWARMVYNEDCFNYELYDLWINLKNISLDNASEIIIQTVKHKDFKSTERSIQKLNNFALECSVNAALASDKKIHNNHQVTVHAHNGLVTLRGIVKNKELRDLIIDTTRKVKGVTETRDQIHLLSDAIQ